MVQNAKFSEIKLIGFGNQTYIERMVVKCRLALRACEVVIFSGRGLSKIPVAPQPENLPRKDTGRRDRF